MSLDQMLSVGNAAAGDEIEISFRCKADESGRLELTAAVLEGSVFQTGVDLLRQSTWEIQSLTGTSVTGTVEVTDPDRSIHVDSFQRKLDCYRRRRTDRTNSPVRYHGGTPPDSRSAHHYVHLPKYRSATRHCRIPDCIGYFLMPYRSFLFPVEKRKISGPISNRRELDRNEPPQTVQAAEK